VEIALSTAGATRTPTPQQGIAEEDAIDELDVLIFDKDQKYIGRRHAYKVNVSYGYTNIYRATMPVGDDYHIHLLANCKSLLDTHDPEKGSGTLLTTGTVWQTVREGLIDLPTRLVPPSSGYASLPMWGTAANVDIQKDLITHVNIDMLRAVASVDLDAHTVQDSFKLQEVYLYYAPDKGYVAYTGIPVAPAYNTVPYVPTSMETTQTTTYAVPVAASNKVLSKLYLYENPHNTRDNAVKQRTRVIVGGQFKGKGDASWRAISYYPIDFIKHETNPAPHDTYRIINRNWKYLFNIIEVTGPGYETPGIAVENFPVNMGVGVIEWSQVHEDVYIEGPFHISLARKEALLYKEAGSVDNLPVTSNIPVDQLTMAFTTTTNGTQTSITNGIQNDWFKVETIVTTTSSSTALTAFRVTALQGYDSAHANDTVKITFGRIKFEITIEQINQSQNGWDDGGGEETDL
jgi:hypothetical protein